MIFTQEKLTGLSLLADQFNQSFLYINRNKQFKTDILKPQLELAALQTWYNSQHDLNSTAYSKLQILQNQLAQGQSFEELARISSEDGGSNQYREFILEIRVLRRPVMGPTATPFRCTRCARRRSCPGHRDAAPSSTPCARTCWRRAA